MRVRQATAADADAIGRVQVETWVAAYSGLMPDEVVAGFDVEGRQRMWREGFARERRPGSAVFVSEVDGAVVGFVSVGAWEGEEGVGELFAIYVSSAHWGTGAGRALIEAAEASMRESGFSEARLWVLEGNERAERFYRAAGWEADGRKVDTFQGAEVPEIRYRKAL
jgi:ribosomal protein S18 acetylase RimI-like enzyme